MVSSQPVLLVQEREAIGTHPSLMEDCSYLAVNSSKLSSPCSFCSLVLVLKQAIGLVMRTALLGRKAGDIGGEEPRPRRASDGYRGH